MTIEKLLQKKVDELLLLGATGTVTVNVSYTDGPANRSWYSWYVHVGRECLHSNCWDGAVAKVKAHLAEQRAREMLDDKPLREALLAL